MCSRITHYYYNIILYFLNSQEVDLGFQIRTQSFKCLQTAIVIPDMSSLTEVLLACFWEEQALANYVILINKWHVLIQYGKS